MKLKKSTYKRHTVYMGIWVMAVMGLFGSCISKPDVELRPETNLVRIRPDQSVYALPALQYHFYNAETRQTAFNRPDDGQGNFEGSLPKGDYHVIAVNTDAAAGGSVTFNRMDSYETANVSVDSSQLTVESDDGESHSQLSTVNSLLSTVYSVVVEDVTASGSQLYQPAPVLLTKQLELKFVLRDDLGGRVAELTGLLTGVYPSVLLHSGLPTQESIDQSPQTAIRFEASGEGDQRQAQLGLFGIRNPEHGNAYRSILRIALNIPNENPQTLALDMTGIFTDIIQNQGAIPPQLTLHIEIRQNAIGIGGMVTGWGNEGETVVERD
jgi:hypothetical protein